MLFMLSTGYLSLSPSLSLSLSLSPLPSFSFVGGRARQSYSWRERARRRWTAPSKGPARRCVDPPPVPPYLLQIEIAIFNESPVESCARTAIR